MKLVHKSGKYGFETERKDGGRSFTSIRSCVAELKNSDRLIESMILYCEGKPSKTVKSWLTRINTTFFYTIESLCILELPETASEWKNLVRKAYADTLTTSSTKSKLEVRQKIWNANIRPFLNFMQQRDLIPLNVIIPKMKRVGELHTNTSFNVTLVGQTKPKKDNTSKELPKSKTLVDVSLHRTDSEYLDEIQFELEQKREKLHQCLLRYWNTIKEHYDAAQLMINSVDPEILSAYESGQRHVVTHCLMDLGKDGKPKPPRRVHIANIDDENGFKLYLHIVDKKMNGMWKRCNFKELGLPWTEPSECENDFLPLMQLENTETIRPIVRFGWCMGVLAAQDISYLIALLMMLNPKFNYESLLEAVIEDKDGKPYLELSDLGETFAIEKGRAKSIKKEVLDGVSLEIINFLLEVRSRRIGLVEPQKRKFLFLCTDQRRLKLTLPSANRLSQHVTGYNSREKDSAGNSLSTLFPSMLDVGLGANVISHSKIRATEGVLEWFRTGSIQAVRRKLGNTAKVVLEHYLPKPLVSAFMARRVRRFQNLMIAAATYNEDYLLEAVDFNSLSKLNKFINDLLSDENNKTPLINHIRSMIDTGDTTPPGGTLDFSLSEQSLTALYLYREAALSGSVSPSVLSKVDADLGYSPLSFIQLANHLSSYLPNEKESRLVNIHNLAYERAVFLKEKTGWSNMFLQKGPFQ